MASVITLCGCDPAFQMEGTVSTSAGAPIAGAHVMVECMGDSRATIEATSNAAGQFQGGAIGWLPATCGIRVSAPHRANYVTPIMKVCVKRPSNVENACLRVVVHAALD
jgi:hypothetical protein